MSRSGLAQVFENLIQRHGPRAQASEVAWALWGALAWNVRLSDKAAEQVAQMEDDVVALLGLHADAQLLFPVGKLDKTRWATLVGHTDVLIGEHWLLAYEANQKGWLNCPQVKKHQVFDLLATNGVSFYEANQAKPQFPAGGRRIPGGDLSDDYA